MYKLLLNESGYRTNAGADHDGGTRYRQSIIGTGYNTGNGFFV